MAKKNTITIDLDYWTTQARKAEIDKVPYQYIRQKVVRTQAGTTKVKIEYWTIPELGITLVAK